MMRMSLLLKYWMRVKSKWMMMVKVKIFMNMMMQVPVMFPLEMMRCTGTLTQVGCALGLTQVEELLQGPGDGVVVVGGDGVGGGCEVGVGK